MNEFTWSEHNISQLKAMAGMSAIASEMAAALGCTRNAVIGKLNRDKIPWPRRRLKFSGSAAPPASPSKRVAHARRLARWQALAAQQEQPPQLQAVRPCEAVPSCEIVAEQSSARVHLINLALHHCRCIDEPSTFLYCGATVEEGGSYCPAHAARFYNWQPAKMRAAA